MQPRHFIWRSNRERDLPRRARASGGGARTLIHDPRIFLLSQGSDHSLSPGAPFLGCQVDQKQDPKAGQCKQLLPGPKVVELLFR